SDSEFAQQEADAAFGGAEGEDGEDHSGRCAAILSNGKRCPNASLPGSRYCGVPAHQALAEHDTEQVLEPEPELEAVAERVEAAEHESPGEPGPTNGADPNAD